MESVIIRHALLSSHPRRIGLAPIGLACLCIISLVKTVARLSLVISLGLSLSFTNSSGFAAEPISAGKILELKLMMVEFINQDREKTSVDPVLFSEELSQMADAHCRELLDSKYTSHWNLAGWKPYMRYSQEGFVDQTSENISSMDITHMEVSPQRLRQEMAVRHQSMLNEKPPKDSHRRSILDPRHTHVGIGLAYSNQGIRLIEVFADRYVQVEPLPPRLKPSGRVFLSGKLLKRGYEVQAVSIFYEPIPRARSLVELAGTYTYSLPDDERILRPKLPQGLRYAPPDSGRGEVEIHGRRFSCPIRVGKDPGVYTLVVWVQGKYEGKAFIATNISIFVE